MNDELKESADERTAMDRWAVPLFEAAAPESVAVTEDDYPLRIDSMPEEGFHPQLHVFRQAG